MDVSADLEELGRTPVAVVSSGAKAILDLPRTMEYLETQGVTVTTLGEAGVEIPAFYSRESGIRVCILLSFANVVAIQFSYN
jgi:pseudouridine-5'-phosphate glycosidase